jgi:hypothetical protein
MGLFGKKKEEEKQSTVVPAPPAPSQNNLQGNTGANYNSEIPKPKTDAGNLSSPPVPGEGLDDIKKQISATNNYSNDSNDQDSESQSIQDNNFAQSQQQPSPQTGNVQGGQNPQENNDDIDSLFDFSELNVQSPVNLEPQTQTNLIENHNTSNEDENENQEDIDLSFIKHKQNKNDVDVNYVTTKQFKDLLEIVESVKNKVKEASETHLKLLDIKSEEDIEFENLRKDFQYIEDKLYEVDNIIFEK